MLRFLLFFVILHLVHCSCPPGFDLVRNGECISNYTRIDSHGDQAATEAIKKCQEIDAQPIIIHDAEDNSYWTSRIQRGGTGTVIGLVCNSTSKKWQWADGSAMNYKPPKYDSYLIKDCTAAFSVVSWVISSPDGEWAYYDARYSISTDVFCTTQLTKPTPAADGCDNFDDDKDDAVCYQVGTTAENWQEAQIICRSFGADVASIHNEKENSFVRRMAVSKGAVNGMYLGATMSGKGNDFGWIDGSAWDYDNYLPGFPMNGLGDCLIMDTSGSSGQWVNVDCSTKLAVACEREQHYTPPSCSSGPWVEGQIIYSPGYPFDSSTPCDFILSVDAGKKVQLEVLSLEANLCCDNLIVFENYFGGNVIANLSGEISDKTYTTSSSNFMKISWLPNGGTNVRGAMMTFRGV